MKVVALPSHNDSEKVGIQGLSLSLPVLYLSHAQNHE